jgi:hypothetical protein
MLNKLTFDSLKEFMYKVVEIKTDFGIKKVYIHSAMILALNGVIKSDELLDQILKQVVK